MDKLDNKIEKALRKPSEKFSLSQDFTDKILRKIQARELLNIRFGWLHFIIVSLFTVFTGLALLIFIGETFADLIEQSLSWMLMIGALIVLFQLIERKLISKKT